MVVVVIVVVVVVNVVIGVGKIIIVIGSQLLVVGKRVVEGREGVEAWAVRIGPVPLLGNRSSKSTNDGDALIGDGAGVSVLVAHHDKGLSVDGEEVVELSVARLEVGQTAIELVESVKVLNDLFAVVLNIGVVLVDVTVVVEDVDAGVSDTVLEGSDGLAESLSSDKHVSGLGNLELVSVLTEKGSVNVESIDSVVKIGNGWVRWGSGLGSTVMHVSGIGVIVVVVGLPSSLGFEGSGCADKKSSGKYFHFKFCFVYYCGVCIHKCILKHRYF